MATVVDKLTSNQIEDSLSPEPESDIDNFEDLWIMTFRQGTSINTKGFSFVGGFHEAYKRAVSHCEIMGYKYLFLRPMITNLEIEEKQKLGRR